MVKRLTTTSKADGSYRYRIHVKRPAAKSPHTTLYFDKKEDLLIRCGSLAEQFAGDEIFVVQQGKPKEGIAIRWEYDRVSRRLEVNTRKYVYPRLF